MKNGYNKSLFDSEDGTCFLCKFQGDTARHEIIHGARRQLSKEDGLWIAVCPACHTRIHEEDNGKYRFLKEAAQTLWEEEIIKNEIRPRWIARYGKSYI